MNRTESKDLKNGCHNIQDNDTQHYTKKALQHSIITTISTATICIKTFDITLKMLHVAQHNDDYQHSDIQHNYTQHDIKKAAQQNDNSQYSYNQHEDTRHNIKNVAQQTDNHQHSHIQHNDTQHNTKREHSIMTLGDVFNSCCHLECYAEWRYSGCCCAECRGA
jgi:hypothetical protein